MFLSSVRKPDFHCIISLSHFDQPVGVSTCRSEFWYFSAVVLQVIISDWQLLLSDAKKPDFAHDSICKDLKSLNQSVRLCVWFLFIGWKWLTLRVFKRVTGHIVFKFWFLRFQFFYLRCNLQLFNLGRNRWRRLAISWSWLSARSEKL